MPNLPAFKKYIQLEKVEKKTLRQIFIWILFATFLARLVPLRWFSKYLGEFNVEKEIVLDVHQKGILIILQKNSRRIKRIIPWKVKCFEEAIAAKKVLSTYKIKSTLYLGVNKNKDEKLKAHAWLKSGNEFVTGKKGHGDFKVVGMYT